jgi:hypothetical protein
MATLAPPACLRLAVLLPGCLFPVWVAAAAPDARDSTQPRLTITSDSTCPSGPAVAEALATLCPPTEWPSGAVHIQAVDDRLVVELTADESTQRQLRVTADCGLRATTVALVIATWTGELSSDAAGAPVLRGRTAAARKDVPARSQVLPAVVAAAVIAATSERELGAGLLLAMSGGVAPGVGINFVQTRAPRGMGFQADLTLPAQRERAASGATTSWTRAAASIALNGRLTLRRLVVAVDAGLAGAYTFTSGHGYAIAQGAQALTGGLVAGARLALPWRRMRIWTEVRAYQWLFPQTVALDTTAGDRVATLALPSSDFQWAVGLAYLFR